jgi:hypothetical protein
VISYGIAPYSSTRESKVSWLPKKASWKKKNITTLIAIRATVTIGKLRVGMSSLSGNTAQSTSRYSIALEKKKPGRGPPWIE